MAKKFMSGADLQNQKIVSLADPTAGTDAATKQYVDNLVAGLSWKKEVRVATTANGTLSSAFANGQTIDGIVLATGDRILLKDQSSQPENGVYVVAASGAPTRATDADATAELTNATVLVTSGTVNAGRSYTQTTANPTVGSSNIVWAQYASGQAYTADGQGIELSGTQFSIELNGGTLTKGASGLSVTTPVDSTVARVFTTGTHASSTSIAITHSLGKQYVIASVTITATGEQVECDVTATSTTVTTFGFASAPGANSLTFTIIG